MRYVDLGVVNKLEERLIEQTEDLAMKCAEFLASDTALDPYKHRVREAKEATPDVQTATQGKELSADVDAAADELEMLVEIVGALPIQDAVQRTAIVDGISEVFTSINQVRAGVRARVKELAATEGAAEFHSQLKLFSQSAANYLDLSDSPQKCDEFLTKLMVQLEELEGQFAEFDEFIGELAEKRQETYDAFESRKTALIEQRNKRAQTLASAAERILTGVQTRVAGMDDVNEINAYFASDLMIQKVRDVVAQLSELGDTVRVDDVQSKLKTIKEEAVRQLKDRQDLYEDGANTIRFGEHRFTVNNQPLDLTTVLRDDELCLHLTGTAFFEPLEDEALLAARDLWNQELVSENARVYRGEFLASRFLDQLEGAEAIARFAESEEKAQLEAIRRFAANRYDEGYVKGVHDADAAKIAAALAGLHQQLGVAALRAGSSRRRLCRLGWDCWLLRSGSRSPPAFTAYARCCRFSLTLRCCMSSSPNCEVVSRGCFPKLVCGQTTSPRQPRNICKRNCWQATTSPSAPTAAKCQQAFQSLMADQGRGDVFRKALSAVKDDAVGKFLLLREWSQELVASLGNEIDPAYADELAAMLFRDQKPSEMQEKVDPVVVVESLAGDHARIEQGKLRLDYHEFTSRLTRYRQVAVPLYRAFVAAKKTAVESARERLKLDQFKPRVMSSFVRNRLIDEVYLPAGRGQSGQADGRRGRGQTHRPHGHVAPHQPARLRQDDADGVYRQSARVDVRQNQWPGRRSPRHKSRPRRGPQRRRAGRDRKAQSRPRNGRQRADLRRRHPALRQRVFAEVYLALRRAA